MIGEKLRIERLPPRVGEGSVARVFQEAADDRGDDRGLRDAGGLRLAVDAPEARPRK